MGRAATLLLPIFIVCLIATPSASAAPPSISGGQLVEVDLAFPPGAVCDFGVEVHLELKARTITFVDANGDPTGGLSVGRIHVWETNAETGQTHFSSISGPSFFDASGALVRGTGSWSGIQLEDGTWIRANGNITFDANVLVTAVRGHVEPLCLALS
jgi:hypothetical protein